MFIHFDSHLSQNEALQLKFRKIEINFYEKLRKLRAEIDRTNTFNRLSSFMTSQLKSVF